MCSGVLSCARGVLLLLLLLLPLLLFDRLHGNNEVELVTVDSDDECICPARVVTRVRKLLMLGVCVIVCCDVEEEGMVELVAGGDNPTGSFGYCCAVGGEECKACCC
jgi:hypothetical protein